MKIIPKLALAAFTLVSPSLFHAQSTTYNIGSSLCGPASTTWIDCYSMPLTIGTTTTTAWIAADYPPNTAEEFLVFHSGSGDYSISNVKVTTGGAYPTELTGTLTGVNGTVGTGTLDLKISYISCKVSRWATGSCSKTSGGEITIR